MKSVNIALREAVNLLAQLCPYCYFAPETLQNTSRNVMGTSSFTSTQDGSRDLNTDLSVRATVDTRTLWRKGRYKKKACTEPQAQPTINHRCENCHAFKVWVSYSFVQDEPTNAFKKRTGN